MRISQVAPIQNLEHLPTLVSKTVKQVIFMKIKIYFSSFLVIKEFDAYFMFLDINTVVLMKQTISDDIKMIAFNFFHNQNQLFTIICDCFDMKGSRHLFFERIRELIAEQKYKDACQCACDLQLYEFSIHDFLIPLILQDKMSVAEKYLLNTIDLQVSYYPSYPTH